VSRALPGLYWINYLGPPYVELIGRQRLLAAPAWSVRALGDGVLVQTDEVPELWDSAGYRERERRIMHHLGPAHFFAKDQAQQRLLAPDFGLPPA